MELYARLSSMLNILSKTRAGHRQFKFLRRPIPEISTIQPTTDDQNHDNQQPTTFNNERIFSLIVIHVLCFLVNTIEMYDAGKVGVDNDNLPIVSSNLLTKAGPNQRQGDNSNTYLSIDFDVNDRLPKWCDGRGTSLLAFAFTWKKSKITGKDRWIEMYFVELRITVSL